jgi:hypothetical protein
MVRIARPVLSFAAIAALAAPAACAHRSAPPPAATDEAAADPASTMTVQVISHSPRPVELYIDAGTGRPLRVLDPHGVAAFRIPRRSLAGSRRMRLVARQAGGGESRTFVQFVPGGRVVWTIEANLFFSSVEPVEAR